MVAVAFTSCTTSPTAPSISTNNVFVTNIYNLTNANEIVLIYTGPDFSSNRNAFNYYYSLTNDTLISNPNIRATSSIEFIQIFTNSNRLANPNVMTIQNYYYNQAYMRSGDGWVSIANWAWVPSMGSTTPPTIGFSSLFGSTSPGFLTTNIIKIRN